MRNSYTISDDGTTATIWLDHKGNSLPCLVDTADLPKLQALDVNWYAHWDPQGHCFYVTCNAEVNGKRGKLLMHRFLMDAPKGLEVDHIHHNPLDNRRSHLEIKTHLANSKNRCGANRNSKSGHRGISHHSCGKFALRVTIDGKNSKYLGLFSTVEEAIAARDKLLGYDKKPLKIYQLNPEALKRKV